MSDAAIPAPPKRSASALAFDTLLWGGVILLLVVSFKPAEINKFPQLFTDTERTGSFAKLFFSARPDPTPESASPPVVAHGSSCTFETSVREALPTAAFALLSPCTSPAARL